MAGKEKTRAELAEMPTAKLMAYAGITLKNVAEATGCSIGTAWNALHSSASDTALHLRCREMLYVMLKKCLGGKCPARGKIV